MNTAILLQTHFVDQAIEAAYARLRHEGPRQADVFVALNCGTSAERLPASTRIPAAAFFLCSDESLLALPYPGKCASEGWRLIPGNTDLIALLFFRRNGRYDRVWTIEYDVHWQGDWGSFLGYFEASPADLLTTTIYRQRETPEKSVEPPFRSPTFQDYPQEERLHAFLPIVRLSQRGFAAIDAAYRAGCAGHHEITWPTIVHHGGLVLEDIGGDGEWARPENRNRFYFNSKDTFTLRPGTFVFRPAFARIVARPNTLWHPVKPAGIEAWDAANWVRLGGVAGMAARLKESVNLALVRRWLAARWLASRSLALRSLARRWLAWRWNSLPQPRGKELL